MTSTRAVPKYKLPPNVLSGYSGHRHRRVSEEEGKERNYQSGAFAELAVGFKLNALEDFTYSEYSIAKDEDDQRRLALSGEVSYHSDAGQHESDFEKEESRLRREFNKVDIEDRYEAAVHSLSLHKQTPEMLIAIVSAKLSQNTTSFADQQIYLHNFFESFDKTGSGFMGETELRTALETGNIQFNDEQFVALFAYFDTSFHGKINWRKFINKIVVPNPKGGLAILPKQITSTAKIFNK